MILDANKISDAAYHKRRAVLGALGAALMLYPLVDRFAYRGFDLDALGWLGTAANLFMLGYFGRLMINSIIEMRRHG